MPDWLTHIVIGLILIEIFNVRKKSLVLIGTILPDILPKIILLGLFFALPDFNYEIFNAFHIPFVLFLVTLLIAPLFRYDYWKVVLLINIGVISHFLADALLRHFSTAGVRLLYPFKFKAYSANLVWPDQSYFILIPAIIVYIAIILLKKKYSAKDIKKESVKIV